MRLLQHTSRLLVFLLTLPVGLTFAQSPGVGIISTVAGTGSDGYSGDGGPATSATLNSSYLATDPSGNVFISDGEHARLREANASTGLISLLAGNGGTGDQSPIGVNDSVDPMQVAADANGNVYFSGSAPSSSDSSEACYIYKLVVSTDALSTYQNIPCPFSSGNTQVSSQLGAMAVDSAGNVFLSVNYYYSTTSSSKTTATYSSVLYEVAAGSGSLTRVAGYTDTQGNSGDGSAASQASIENISGIAVDGNGNLYLADIIGCVIREITQSTGIINTIAGTGGGASTGDGGLATNASIGPVGPLAVDTGRYLYLASGVNPKTGQRYIAVRAINLATGTIATVAGNGTAGISGDGGPATSALLSQVSALAVDSQGNLYISDLYRVRIVGATPQVVRPVVSSITPTQGVAGTSVTISGNGFGATQGSSTVSFGSLQATVTSWNATTIQAVAPQGVNTTSVFVQVNGEAESNAPVFTVLQQPQISQINPGASPPGSQFTIQGSSFGPTQGSSSIVFEGMAFPSGIVASWSNTQILVDLPSVPVNSPVDGLLYISNAAGTSNEVAFTLLPSGPAISAILPDPGSVGSQVTIYGNNFGPASSPGTVAFGSVSATPVSWSPTAIVVTIPSGAQTGSVVVNANSMSSSGFLYLISALCSPPS